MEILFFLLIIGSIIGGMVCAYLFGGCNIDGVMAAILFIVVVGLFYSLFFVLFPNIEKRETIKEFIVLNDKILNNENNIKKVIDNFKFIEEEPQIEKSKKNIKIIKLKNLSFNGCNGISEYIKSSKNKYKIEETVVNKKNQCEKGLKNNIVYQISP